MIFLGYKPSESCIMRFLLCGLNPTAIVIRGSVCIMHVYSLVSYRTSYPTQDRIVVRMTIDRMEWIMTLFSNFWKSLNYPYGILWMTVRKIEMENFFSRNCDLRNGVLSIIRSSFFLSTLLTSRDRTIETLWIFAFFEAIFNNFFMIN